MFRSIKLLGWLGMMLTGMAAHAQTGTISGKVQARGLSLESASILVDSNSKATLTDKRGHFTLRDLAYGTYVLRISAIGHQSIEREVKLDSAQVDISIELLPQPGELNQVVVTGTLKPVMRSESPVPVEVYTPQFLKKNPSPSIFEALQNVNGVRPQINCSVCNTGDIHINGLEGPYTMVTIDGMPIVSSLATVYGLFGIPNQLIERIEIVKGPASSLYGSEAVGGLINIITRNPLKAPVLSLDFMGTSWKEYSADLGLKWKAGKHAHSLLGVNYFNYQQPRDNNKDNFTDVTLQHRISIFNKWSWQRPGNRAASIAWRYFYEDRWGGDMRFNRSFRGTDSIYGESIYTSRLELLGNYEFPLKEKILYSYSYNFHNQDSYYGTTPFKAKQHIAFNQFTWDRNIADRHDLLVGLAARFTWYDDNSTATQDTLTKQNRPDKIFLPGIFVQDEITLSTSQKLLLGLRYDHHPVHGDILTPRLAYKWSMDKNNILRLNAGTGFRVVNLFTEDHAALTGARDVVIEGNLDPERSYNVNLNYSSRIPLSISHIGLDVTAWYTHFTNQILPDYVTNPNQIIYRNLDGYATSKGISLNIDYNFANRLKMLLGATFQDVRRVEQVNNKTTRTNPLLTEKWSCTWLISYGMPKGWSLDYTGNIYGPMQLPLAGPLDPRREYSPVWSIQNLQCTKKINRKWEIYGGVKNLLNWTPARNNPFLIARTNDPFDKKVQWDGQGNVMPTAENPYGLTFDPTYVYAPNQGRRGFVGVRFLIAGN
jgi:outer membrane receptor for ferrienterochelin and colicins